MKPQPLIGALPIIAKMLGRKLGVEVVIGAPQAATDGNTIYLPALPADDPALAVLVNGFIDHEAAHVRFTDWTLPKPEQPLEGRLVNILEDVRIERALGQQYPGTRANLARLVTAMVERGEFAVLPTDAPLANEPADAVSEGAESKQTEKAAAVLRDTKPVPTLADLVDDEAGCFF